MCVFKTPPQPSPQGEGSDRCGEPSFSDRPRWQGGRPTRLPPCGRDGGRRRETLAPDISTVGNGLVMPYFFSISFTPGAGASGSPLPSTGISIQRVTDPSTQPWITGK